MSDGWDRCINEARQSAVHRRSPPREPAATVEDAAAAALRAAARRNIAAERNGYPCLKVRKFCGETADEKT
eukprot:CAMPEP_0178994798 /NCGR_PEP_ID=MMETSP0795-20121207/7471_1 /TAXON_ID=88552 /ORGANISM="Amoebophrya sp., Strain Ameob2" /LENGTH=70 /DNA_ID=CAMNT_0020687033 /DNA_START=657 /DNA_END=866 /DNA_ORIENTATION=+